MALSKKPYKGCRDFFPIDMRSREYLFEKMKEAALSFGFEAYDGPLLEEVELYKAKSGEELINEQIYAFIDRGEREVAIRPEMTPTLARMVANIHREFPKPLRWYAIPNLMRYEKPQRGRLREHWQFNCDIFGAPEGLGEVEILSTLCFFLESLGADESMFSIQINDRAVVDSLLFNVFKVDKDSAYKLYKIIDRCKKITPEALRTQSAEYLKDEKHLELFNRYLNIETFEELITFSEEVSIKDNIENFLSFFNKLKDIGFSKYLNYDPTIVRGLDYYTGIVFEIFDKHPDNRRAIAGGGAYANLLQIFDEPALQGVGFGMGDVTLADFLKTHNLMPDFSTADNDLFVCYLDEQTEARALELALKLRKAGLKVETNLGSIKFKKIFQTAEKKGHKFLIALGQSEIENNALEVKNLKTKETTVFNIEQTEEIKNLILGNK